MDIEQGNTTSPIFRDYLNGKTKKYLNSTSSALKVRDYIAGMTDRYFTTILQKLVVPDITLGELEN
jgi:dGTPase